MGLSSDSVDVRRHAGWLPAQQQDLEDWLAGHCQRADAHADTPLHPVVQEFQQLIDADPVIRLYLNEMIEQVPGGRPYTKRHLRDVPHLLRLINEVLTMAPEFSPDKMLATPLGAILDWTMGTPAGFAAYRDRRLNTMLRKILTTWSVFLSGPDSRYVLTDSPTGWMSEPARQAIGIEQFQHDPAAPHWGFTSWNDFFTRRLTDTARPVAAPHDPSVIVSPCEATPYGLATGVQRQDRFWLKNQPYSLLDLLAGDPAADRFVGGTVYQAFLSATNYHRWHSPITGTIVRAFVQPGTYYSEADAEGADATEPMNSQAYLAHVATRAIILIRADDPRIGLVAFVPIGMADVSSCIINPAITPGARIDKGDELGYFQFGGSTYCLLLQPGVVTDVRLDAIPEARGHDPIVTHVRSPLLHAGSTV